MRGVLALLLLVPSIAIADPYFNSPSENCTSSATRPSNWILCDDFDDGSWYTSGNDCSTGAATCSDANNDGWYGCNAGGNPCSTPAPPAVTSPSGLGVGGTGFAARSTSQAINGGDGARGAHSFFPSDSFYDEVYQRFYLYLEPGYVDNDSKKGFEFPRALGDLSVGWFGFLTDSLTQMKAVPMWECSNDAGSQTNRNPENPVDTWCNLHQNRVNDSCMSSGIPWSCCTGFNTGTCVSNTLTLTTGTWYYIETYTKLNTYGVFNGVHKLWADNCGANGTSCSGTPTQRMSYTTVGMIGPNLACSSTDGSHCLGGNYIQTGSPGDRLTRGWYYQSYGNVNDAGSLRIDNLAVKAGDGTGTNPIGFIGASSETWTIDSFTMILPSTCTQGACSDPSEVNVVASGTATGSITWERDTDCDAANGVSYTTISECANSSSCLTSNGAGSCDMSGKTPGTYTITVQSCRGTTPVCDTETATFQVLAPAAIPGTRGSGTYSISELLEMFNDPYAPAVAMR